jgi:hypothetical protein
MRVARRAIIAVGFLSLALLPLMAAVPPETAASTLNALPPAQMPVAIAQPLGAMNRGPLVGVGWNTRAHAMLPESGLLVLVGSALLGLASIVRRTTPNH